MAGVSLTWLGHAAFRIDSPGGKRIYLDPWLSNPSAPEGAAAVERIDILALTHGHSDHLGEAVELGKRFSPTVVAIFELASWLESQGVEGASARGMNKGGTQDVDGTASGSRSRTRSTRAASARTETRSTSATRPAS